MIVTIMHYFHARDFWDWLFLMLDGILASAIFALLLFAHGSMYRSWHLRWHERIVRFVLASAYGILALRVWFGWYYTPVEPTHVIVNAIVLSFVGLAHGDVSVMMAALRQVNMKRFASGEREESLLGLARGRNGNIDES